MIIFDKDTKTLDVPVGLGNLEINIVSGSTPAAAGVNSINGQQGDLTLKTVNGNQLLGSGDIVISGNPEEIITSAVTVANEYTEEHIASAVSRVNMSVYSADSVYDVDTFDQIANIVRSGQAFRITPIYSHRGSTSRGIIDSYYNGGNILIFKVTISATREDRDNYAAEIWCKLEKQNNTASYTCLGYREYSLFELDNYATSAQTQAMIASALTDYATSAQTASAIATATQNMVTSTYVNKIWVGTTAQYNAITTKDPNTLYIVQ